MHDFIAGLPKVELHLHLEGSLRPGTMLRLAKRNGVDLGATTPGQLEERYVYDGFDDFLRLFLSGLEVMRSAEDFADVTEALAEELVAQNVRYVEVTTTPFNHHRRGIHTADYTEGLDEGRRRASGLGLELGWVCDIPRELEPPDLGFTADFVTGVSAPEGVVALGLGGPEPGFPPHVFADSFAAARAAGLGSVPHAGETAGPASVWSAVEHLDADRIGHGIRAVEDPDLLAHLATEQVPLEVSMTSNVKLGVVPDIAAHPLPALLDAGIPVCLNTDDPAYFGTDLTTELGLAMACHGLDIDDVRALQGTALRHSFASEDIKASIGTELRAFAGT